MKRVDNDKIVNVNHAGMIVGRKGDSKQEEIIEQEGN